MSIKNNETKNKLDQVKLTNFVLQDNISDRTFVRQLISEWNLQKPELPLALSWTEKGWQLIGCWPRNFASPNMLNLTDESLFKKGQQLFNKPLTSMKSSDVLNFLDEAWHLIDIHTVGSLEEITMLPTVWFIGYHPAFNLSDWKNEQKAPLPHLLEKKTKFWLVGERRDQLTVTGNGTGTLEWATYIRGTLDIWPVKDSMSSRIVKYRF